MQLGLGIDTGGTYTDSVIVNFETGEVMAKAKALTTRYDLSVGIANSIDNLGYFNPAEIKLVSTSTTLATNSIVEGKGANACLLGIGYDRDTLYNYGLKDSFPIKVVKLVNGGHDVQGQEIAPLDIESLKEAIISTKDIVDAYGVSAYGGVRNSEHEIKAKEMIKELAGLPVICGHDLTSNLNSIRRAITVAFNARLVPVIRELLMSIKENLCKRGIDAPLMVVKGDGHIVSDEVAMERPVETVLSGPAASIIGGSNLSNIDSGIVVDMGGTTTDIAIVRNGLPDIKADGAIVGGWRTSIRAANIQTSGLGGDSHITLDRAGNVILNPQRVIPLSLASSQYKEVVDELRQLAQREWTSYLVGPTDFFVKMKNSNHYAMNQHERGIVDALNERPMSSYTLSVKLDLLHPALLNTIALEEHGIISRVGFTPTDLLHAEGSYSIWDGESAKIAADIYARHLQMGYDDFIAYAKNAVIDKLSTEILKKLMNDEIDDLVSFDTKTSSLLLCKLLGKDAVPDLEVKTSVKLPIIATGAPVTAYFPSVASRLSAELVIPEHAEVANAVGAITGSIIEAVDVLIDPIYSAAGLVCYTVHSPEKKVDFPDLVSAVEYAESSAKKVAKERAIRAGASKQVEVKIQRLDETTTAAGGYGGGDLLLSSHIKAIAIGKPDILSQDV